MFVGREEELRKIKSLLNISGKKALMLYGKRRVGKSALILESVKDADCKVIYYECLMTSLSENLKNLERKIQEIYSNKYLHFENFEDVFEYLGDTKEKVILIIDEYSYLKSLSEKNYIDSLFQRIIDQMQENISLVLLGSYVGMMKELLEKENPLFGRFHLIMNVKSFDYKDAALFYPKYSIREKIEFYSIFDGSPFTCSFLNAEKSLSENITALLLHPYGVLHSYIENILLSELNKVSNANMILSALANGKMRYSELESILNLKSNGLLDKQLKNLLDMEVITRSVPINRKTDKKKVFYEISDNMVRFYYRYIYKDKDVIMRIGEEAFYQRYIAPTIQTFISHRFEDIARQYFSRQSREKTDADIYDIGTFWYDLPKEHRNEEFDCVIQNRDGYSFYEVKYYDHPMSRKEYERELEQVKQAASIVKVKGTGCICLSGFEFEDDQSELISGEMLYE